MADLPKDNSPKFTTKADFYPLIGELVATWGEVELVCGMCLAIVRKSRKWKLRVDDLRSGAAPRLKGLRSLSDELLVDRPDSVANTAKTFDAIWAAKIIRDDVVHGYLTAPFPKQRNLSVWDPLGGRKQETKFIVPEDVAAAIKKARRGERGLRVLEIDLRYRLFVSRGIQEPAS